MSVPIHIEHVKKVYENKHTVIEDLSATIKEGEFFTLLGPSGCGKTTLLRMVAGFNSIESGVIRFGEKEINRLPAHKRNIGMVFQNYAVFPHMTTRENVAFGLREHHVKEPELSKRTDEILKVVQIENLADRMPANMSGGQQQRIALARAIVIRPDVLLMDEPLSNLDAKLRVEMRDVIRHIQQKAGITTIYVTHDQEEALAISDRIAVMNKGQIQQVDTPIRIYRHPKNLFVATFMGQSNIVPCRVEDKTVSLAETDWRREFTRIRRSCLIEHAKMCIRPNDFIFAEEGLPGIVKERIFFGTAMNYTISTPVGDVLVTCNVNDPLHAVEEHVFLDVASAVVNVFDETGDSIMEDAQDEE